MPKYIAIRPVQEPFDLGSDATGRCQVVFNVNAESGPSSAFLRELAKVLTDASVGTSANIFLTSVVKIPTGEGPYLSLIATGGAPPEYTQDVAGAAYQRPSAQVIVRAKSYAAADAMARAAYNAFDAVTNLEVTA